MVLTQRCNLGTAQHWNLLTDLVPEAVVVHPEADRSFLKTVRGTVKVVAASLIDCVGRQL
jgi:hypothetical protein